LLILLLLTWVSLLLLLPIVVTRLSSTESAEQGREDLDQQVGVVVRHAGSTR
jgi:hypothetical protein